MIVVADTSPINYLILIDQIDLLEKLYQKVLIPPMVLEELNRSKTPKPVRDWIANSPPWLSIQSPTITLELSPELDAGETEALTLASEIHADLILIDDREAKQAAAELHITATGLLGVLGEAAANGLAPFDDAILALRTTSFYPSEQVIKDIRQRLEFLAKT